MSDTCIDLGPTILPEPAGCRLVMIEDHAMVAAALGAVIAGEPDLSVVDTAGSIEHGLAAVSRHQPDVVLTDLVLGDGVITDHLPELRRRSPGSRVVLVTGAPTEKAVLDALEAGVSGFIDKARSVDELVDAVRRVAAGELVASPTITPVLLAHLGRRGDRSRSDLTRRELDVLQLLARGESTDAIAAELVLSAHTVRNHIARAMLKLRAHNRLEAVAEAVRRGLVASY